MKLSEQIEAARPSAFWVVSGIGILIVCVGWIALTGGDRDSMKMSVIALAGSSLCLIASVLYTRRDIRAATERAKAMEEQAGKNSKK
jgi:hypothetical protein